MKHVLNIVTSQAANFCCTHGLNPL